MKSELIAEILEHGKDDWVDFAEVMSIVRSQTGFAEPAVIALSVEIVGEMVSQRRVAVGDLRREGEGVSFAAWNGPPSQIVERLQRDVAGLGHRPGIGDICWLSTT